MMRLAPCTTLFPYTTLFRSRSSCLEGRERSVRRKLASLGLERCAEAMFGKEVDLGGGDGLINTPDSEALLRSEEHTSELQSLAYLVCRLLLEKKKALTVGTSKYHVDDVALGVCTTGAEAAGVPEVRTSLSDKQFD